MRECICNHSPTTLPAYNCTAQHPTQAPRPSTTAAGNQHTTLLGHVSAWLPHHQTAGPKQESHIFSITSPPLPPPPHTLQLSGRPDCIPSNACCSIDSPLTNTQQQLQRPAMLQHAAAAPHGPAAPVGSRCCRRCTAYTATAAEAGHPSGRRLLWLQPTQPAALLLASGPHPQRLQ